MNLADYIPSIRFLSAAGFLVAILLLILLRIRQVKAAGSEVKSLKEDIKRQNERRCPHYTDKEIRSAKKAYVRPDCAQVDPANEAEFRKFASVREPIFTSVRRYINSETRRHLLVLADSGMGKTTFCLNFFAEARKSRPDDVALISLARSNAATAILNVPSKRTTTLILDALDEDPKAIANGTDRLTELMDMAADFPLVIVTCRSHFFENDAAIPIRTGVSKIIPRSGGKTSAYEFSRLYLLPFDEAQIGEFLRRSFPFFSFYSVGFRRRARALIEAIPDLSVRPMLLTLVPDLIKKRIEPKEIFELYDYMVQQWLLREEKWVNTGVLLEASREIAFHLAKTKQERGIDRLKPEHVRSLGLTGDDLDWKHLTTRSLLNRDSEGNLKFAHRSIMEFLVVKGALEGDSRATNLVWTDFMRELLLSYGNLHPTRQDGASLLGLLIVKRKVTRFPYADPIPPPMVRARSEFQSIATPSRHQYLSKKLIPAEWVKTTTKVERDQGHVFVEDRNNGFLWRIPDLSDNDIRLQAHLYKSSLVDAFKLQSVDGFELPSFAEFISLLRIQRARKNIDLIHPSHFYWLGDKSDRGSHMLVSLESTFDSAAATLVLTAVKDDGLAMKLNLYAVDPYRLVKGVRAPSALQARLKRRGLVPSDISFSN